MVETGVLLKIQGGALREHPTVKRSCGGLWISGGLFGHLVQDFAHDRKVMDPVTEESQQVQK